jgi:hypothetical protein
MPASLAVADRYSGSKRCKPLKEQGGAENAPRIVRGIFPDPEEGLFVGPVPAKEGINSGDQLK